ncbi:MAG: alanine--tRNA ligase [Cytophagales bacterium]|nr:alanine--tRNA ligase [Cytophagales bacterium]
MTSREIRKQFLDFFASKMHSIVPSAPLVLKNDPTLMFTNAGMNQFKDYFLGNKKPDNKRIADTQKCLRVTGKHNDLEDVGYDTYHHTLFEMLGNWSFGDYFKKEAISWAWELLTEVYMLPKDRLYVTVFEGDSKENLDFDQESYDIWTQYVAPSHILKGNKKDNFWEMGDQGPCGPCSEIHIDIRPQHEIDQTPGAERVNNDDPQVIEIWNNVFIQYNRKADGSLEMLPSKHVDTGMGFERLVRVIQGKASNYDTDIFIPLIQHLEKETKFTYTQGIDGFGKTDIAMRVVVDHIRAVAFAIADGQLPSNAKAGYVIRRILRRAVRYGYTFLGYKEPFMYRLVPILAHILDVFTELGKQSDFIANVIKEEEASFLRTLENGIKLLDNYIQNQPSKIVTGSIAFELYDTYGFPYDLTALIARENGYSVDEIGFKTEMENQKNRSKAAALTEKSDWVHVTQATETDSGSTKFIGYDEYACEAQIVKYRKISTKDDVLFQIVLTQTPFYAESGGQIGDTGTLSFAGTPLSLHIINTKKENDLIVHITPDDVANIPASILNTGNVWAQIDIEKRTCTAYNHTSTHLLQSALRSILGSHVAQKGSLVTPQVLRFDFAHFTKVTAEQIIEVEKMVNTKIRQNIPLDEKRNVPISQALQMGATALFGEKYGNEVRVITFDPAYSVELCGGTHVKATGEIGFFKITSETSVAAGVRRIEAVTAAAAENYIQEQANTLHQINYMLKAKDPLKAIEILISEKNLLQKKVETYEIEYIKAETKNQKSKIKNVNGANLLISQAEVSSPEALKTLLFELKNQVPDLVCIMAADIEGKPYIAIMISENMVKDKGLDANKMIRELATYIDGSGGGQAFYAIAGGKNTNGIPLALQNAARFVQ